MNMFLKAIIGMPKEMSRASQDNQQSSLSQHPIFSEGKLKQHFYLLFPESLDSPYQKARRTRGKD